jgi:uncharacterized protein (TIGR03435 family)
MERFAEILSRQTDLPVVNHTNLEGVFNLKLEWTPDNVQLANPPDNTAIQGPSLFTAVEEQLGLRLRSEKMLLEVLVIDHLEKPSEN